MVRKVKLDIFGKGGKKLMKKMLWVFLLIISVLITGCASNNESKTDDKTATVTKINAGEAKVRLGNDKKIILVDVRTPEEYYEEHILNAILLPLDTINEKAKTVIPDQEATYFVYCRSGNRSATAAAQLVKMGYKNIYDLGGIKDWPYEKVAGNE